MEPKIGDWIRPVDPIINGTNHGHNLRIIIEILGDGHEYTTVCDTFGIEKGIWNEWNTEFAGRILL
jgi:hypothetical protein